jgi:DNA-binding response OmpR family regulator
MSESRSVLLVDDDLDLVESLKLTFEQDGFQVQTAFSGEDGYAAAIANKPDVIVLDVMMGGEHGFNICKKLKAEAATSKIPIMIFSAMTGRNEEKFPLAIGLDTDADEFIEKPKKPSEVLQQVKELLARG